VETNIVTFEVQGTDAQVADAEARLARAGVHVKPVGHHRFRAVTHSTLSREDIDVCAATIVESITESVGV
jgi:threonine aldolase